MIAGKNEHSGGYQKFATAQFYGKHALALPHARDDAVYNTIFAFLPVIRESDE